MTNLPSTGWTPISQPSQTTTHGGSMLFEMNFELHNNGTNVTHVTCMPLVDGEWAGSWGPDGRQNGTFWTEGVKTIQPGAYETWNSVRIYAYAAPAGVHTLEVQCFADGGAFLGDLSGSLNKWSVLEFGQ